MQKQEDGTPYAGQQFGYSFDDIGTREQATANGQTSVYSANAVNQYTSRSVPGYIDILGEAATGATVTVNFEPVTRQGSYFHGQLAVDNDAADVYEALKVAGVLSNVNESNEDAVAEEALSRFVAQDPETFTYDGDGNLTSDGRWTHPRNGDNRLVKMDTRSSLSSSVPDLTVEFGYDSQGRRFKKTVTSNAVSTTTYFL